METTHPTDPLREREPAVFEPRPFADHALVDSGAGEKLERFGSIKLVRPDPQALWPRRFSGRDSPWAAADLTFVRESDRGGRWERGPSAPKLLSRSEPEWPVEILGGRFLVRPTPFKHVGVFPEQAPNWTWTAERVGDLGGERPALLNLFGYTGVASVLAARAGYRVTHVDASKSALAWTRANVEASGLESEALRLVLDDALAFARREARRGSVYAAVLLDPPRFGRGPRGETWRFEERVAELVETCGRLLAERSFLILSSYAIGTSPLAMANLLSTLEGGAVAAGELALPEEADSRSGKAPRLLPCGFSARWWRGIG